MFPSGLRLVSGKRSGFALPRALKHSTWTPLSRLCPAPPAPAGRALGRELCEDVFNRKPVYGFRNLGARPWAATVQLYRVQFSTAESCTAVARWCGNRDTEACTSATAPAYGDVAHT